MSTRPLRSPRKSSPRSSPNLLLKSPPRPQNPFILYRAARLTEIRAQVRSRGEPIVQSNLSKHIAALWRTESPEVKKYFSDLAIQKKAEHERQYPGYVYRPMRKEEKARLKEKGKRSRVEELISEAISSTKAEDELQPPPRRRRVSTACEEKDSSNSQNATFQRDEPSSPALLRPGFLLHSPPSPNTASDNLSLPSDLSSGEAPRSSSPTRSESRCLYIPVPVDAYQKLLEQPPCNPLAQSSHLLAYSSLEELENAVQAMRNLSLLDSQALMSSFGLGDQMYASGSTPSYQRSETMWPATLPTMPLGDREGYPPGAEIDYEDSTFDEYIQMDEDED